MLFRFLLIIYCESFPQIDPPLGISTPHCSAVQVGTCLETLIIPWFLWKSTLVATMLIKFLGRVLPLEHQVHRHPRSMLILWLSSHSKLLLSASHFSSLWVSPELSTCSPIYSSLSAHLSISDFLRSHRPLISVIRCSFFAFNTLAHFFLH